MNTILLLSLGVAALACIKPKSTSGVGKIGYLSVFDLDRDQLIMLKQNYLTMTLPDISWGELAAADNLIDDKFIYDYYSDVSFVPEDFGIEGTGNVDQNAVREILLWFENTEELYRMFTVPIANSLVKKIKKGAQLNLDVLAKSSMIDNVVRETLRHYFRHFGSFPVSPNTRREMKKAIADSILSYAQDQYDYEQRNA